MATYRAQRQARREVTEQMLEYLHNQRDSIFMRPLSYRNS